MAQVVQGCVCCGACCRQCTWPAQLCFELLELTITDGAANVYPFTLGTEDVTPVYIPAGCIDDVGIITSGIAHTGSPCSVVLPCSVLMGIQCIDGELVAYVQVNGTLVLTACSSVAASLVTPAVVIPTVDCSPLLLDTGSQSATVDDCTIDWRFTVTEGPC